MADEFVSTYTHLMMDANAEQDVELPKFPFKRLKYALDQVVKTGIPLHIRLLNTASENIDNLKNQNCPLELRLEQVKATRTVQLLKTDLFELDKLNLQVEDEDQELFQQMVQSPLKDAVEALTEFMNRHSDVLGPLSDIDDDTADNTRKFPELKCNLNLESTDEIYSQGDTQSEITPIIIDRNKPPSKNWSLLKKELMEIHMLIQKFSSLVFKQQDSVDCIQSNIIETCDNVQDGKKYLRKAALLKAASFPLLGAVMGGLVLGPIGAIAGFKLSGSVALMAGGSILGYGTGVKLKKKQQALCTIEMKALTYPSEYTSPSSSNPELSVSTEAKKEC